MAHKTLKEAQARKTAAALSAMARARRRERNLPDLLVRLVQEDARGNYADAPELIRHLARGFRLCPTPLPHGALKRLLLHLHARAERLLHSPGPYSQESYATALVRLAQNHRLWIRPPEEWRPESKSPARQFSSLARHLLAAYPVPGFMESVFFGPDPFDRVDWYYHLGTGKSIRTATGMNAPLTKRMAHCFTQAPDDSDVLDAIRWGQVLGQGGTERLARAVTRTWMGRYLRTIEEEAWWATVLQWFAAHPMLDPAQVGPLFDYLSARRYGDEDLGREPDPEFSMKGRSPAALLQLSERWHREVSQVCNPRLRREFPPSGFAPGRWVLGAPPFTEVWTMQELRNSRQLVEEGRAMHHCVATYADSAEKGRSALWSLKVDRYGSPERAVTVEVDPAARAVVQVRGRFNRDPDASERNVLALWAEANRLKLDFD